MIQYFQADEGDRRVGDKENGRTKVLRSGASSKFFSFVTYP